MDTQHFAKYSHTKKPLMFLNHTDLDIFQQNLWFLKTKELLGFLDVQDLEPFFPVDFFLPTCPRPLGLAAALMPVLCLLTFGSLI